MLILLLCDHIIPIRPACRLIRSVLFLFVGGFELAIEVTNELTNEFTIQLTIEISNELTIEITMKLTNELTIELANELTNDLKKLTN